MISPLAYVDPEAKIGKNVTIEPFAYIEKDVEIGDDCIIMAYASVLKGTRMGKGNHIHHHAVLGAEPVVKAEPHKTAVAVSTVVIFGTISMFLYPALWRAGMLDLSPEQMGLYTGATLHEVAHVVGAGNAMGETIADSAVIVKMIRVMMLAPVLLVMGLMLARKRGSQKGTKITIPWFAFGFLAIIGFNSLNLLPATVVNGINSFDTFLLTMAMTALGTETSIEKFKRAGAKPFLLAALLYVWLLGGGYLLAKWLL